MKSIVLPSGNLDFISFSIITGAIVGASCIDRFIFAPESKISSMLVIVLLGGGSGYTRDDLPVRDVVQELAVRYRRRIA